MKKDIRILNNAGLEHFKQIDNYVDMNALLDRFVKFIDVSNSSVQTYANGIRRFLRFLSDKGIAKPNRESVQMYKQELLSRKCKPSTVALYLSSIRRFFSWLESETLYSNITAGVKAPKLDKGHKRDALSALQLQGIIGSMQRETLEEKRNFAIFTLIASCGLRTMIANG